MEQVRSCQNRAETLWHSNYQLEPWVGESAETAVSLSAG